jgi:hypothetical protein
VRREPFLSSIHKCLNHVDGGLFVVWAPAAAGKTENVKQVACEWQRAHGNKRRHAVYVDSYIGHNGPRDVLHDLLHVRSPTDLKFGLEDLEAEALLVLDQFDEAFATFKGQENDLEVLALELAQQSRAAEKNFCVLVVVRDYVLADKIISWNGYQKLLLCADTPGGNANGIARFKFEQEQVLEYAGKAAQGWCEATRNAVAAAASKSGNMVTTGELVRDPLRLALAEWQERIALDAQAWQLGCDYLAGNTRRRREAQEAVGGIKE